MHRLEIWGAADDLASIACRLLEQDVEGAADPLRVESGLVPVDPLQQAVEPLGFYRFGNLIGHVRRRRSGPGGILEGVGAGVADLVDQRERRVEIVLALAGKADDE